MWMIIQDYVPKVRLWNLPFKQNGLMYPSITAEKCKGSHTKKYAK